VATDREQRYATTDALADELRRWLDGRAERERRHREAEELTAHGKTASQRYLGLRDEIAAAQAEAEAEAKKYRPYQPVSEKRPLIKAREKVEEFRVDLALAFAEAQKLLDGALLQEPDNKSAKAELVRIWKDRLADAERRRDKADIAYAKVMIERYADAPLVEEGQLVLKSDPPAEVWLSRFEEVDGVLTPVDGESLGTTPLGPIPLPCGFRDTRYPVLIEWEKTWTGEVKLRTDEEIGEGFAHVPAGPFIYGEGEKTTTKTLPDFAIQKYPVTFAEYIEFLETLDDAEAKERLPQTPGEGPLLERAEDKTWHVLSILIEGPAREWSLERYGEGFELRCPLVAISYDDAEAYCKWKCAATGKEWRLPTEEEREKAARGVDGRRFAWGDLEDASLGKCRESREVNAQPEPVGAFPTAESACGMGDASGGVWDWTSSWEDERRSSRVLRGGSWFNPSIHMRCAGRGSHLPRARGASVGFRCARSL
jgi:serine/threonine-protein kinase